MDDHRYILEKYSGPGSRFICPRCEKPRKFTRYIDQSTGKHIHPDVGRCDREEKCGYHFTPSEYFKNGGKVPEGEFESVQITKTSPSFIDYSIMKKSMASYHINSFVKFLYSISDSKKVDEVIQDYRIGTSKKFGGSTIFWQIDSDGNVRSGKIMGYHTNGKRVKEPFVQFSWAHTALKLKDFKLKQCFFGEHLISDKTVCIVEGEKTAIIAAIHIPEYTWIATGGKNGASWSNPGVFQSLKGKRVILFPDKGVEDEWSKKSQRVTDLANIKISRILQYTDLEDGEDLADFILNSNGLTCASISAESHQEELEPPPVALSIENVSNIYSKYGYKGLIDEERVFLDEYLQQKNPLFNKLKERLNLEYE